MAALQADRPVLEVDRLTATFAGAGRTVRAVREVSLQVQRGQKVAVVGESGCGKSTLALAILGLLDPPGRVAAGSVILNGREISGLSDRAMRHVRGREMSLIFQDPMGALDQIKSIGAQLMDTIRRHQPALGRRAVRQRAVALLNEVEIAAAERRLDDYPHQYSGGMRQRVMIAIALANDPTLVIADEPTTALDVTTQAQVMALMDRLVAARGVAVMLITHNLGVVAEFCDAVQVMYAGRIVERGTIADIFDRPLHPYTRALLDSIPEPAARERRLRAIGGAPPDLGALPPGCAFEPRCPLGHGRTLCLTVPPLLRPLQGDRSGAVAECHFLEEQQTLQSVSMPPLAPAPRLHEEARAPAAP